MTEDESTILYEIDQLYKEGLRLKNAKLYESAEVVLEKARTKAEPLRNAELTARILDALGGTAFCANNYVQAESLYRDAISRLESGLHPEHGDIAPILDHLSRLFIAEGNFEAARQTSERSLSLKEKTFSPNHSEIIESMRMCAIVDNELGDFDQAAKLLQKGMTILEKSTIGIFEEFVLALAKVYHTQNKNEEAQKLYKQALEAFSARSGRRLRCGRALSEYARFLEDTGRHEEAVAARSRVSILEQDIGTIDQDESLPNNDVYQRITYPVTTFH
jgi:tetratricopeptide (TPR) repeat protein